MLSCTFSCFTELYYVPVCTTEKATKGEPGLNLGRVNSRRFLQCKRIAIRVESAFRGSLLWNTLKDEVKRAGTLTKFKKSIVKWDGKSCSGLICK